MGAALLDTPLGNDVMKLVNSEFGKDVAAVMKNGPLELLSDTKYTQPACVAHGYVIANLHLIAILQTGSVTAPRHQCMPLDCR
jgi:hypothetical protein